MNVPLEFARRYLFSKKSTNAINIISYVSMIGMMVCTTAFILILSVFNGFEGLVTSLYDSFYPDFRVEATAGKNFELVPAQLEQIKHIDGVRQVSQVVEETALLMYNDKQHPATIKGVDQYYSDVTGIDTSMAYGDPFYVKRDGMPYAVLGAGIDQALAVSLRDPLNRLSIFVPRRGDAQSFLPTDEFRQKEVMASGIFAIQDDFDNQYVFVPLDFAQDLLQLKENSITALEIGLTATANKEKVAQTLRNILDEGFTVQDKYQQNELLYRIMNTEKLAVYLILSFVLLIVAFNMVGSLSMLVIEKRFDLGILRTMGADDKLIRNIFVIEGLLQALLAVVFGFLIAIGLILMQQQFGLIALQGSGTFVVQYYPVEMRFVDFLIVSLIVMVIALVAAYIPASRAARLANIVQE